MTIGVLVAGLGLVLAGLLAIGFGIPVKEFSFGNTLMLIGAMGVCTGAIMIAPAQAPITPDRISVLPVLNSLIVNP